MPSPRNRESRKKQKARRVAGSPVTDEPFGTSAAKDLLMILGFATEPSSFDVPCDSHGTPQYQRFIAPLANVFSSNCEIIFAEWSKPAT
jgi:hypothetical protein